MEIRILTEAEHELMAIVIDSIFGNSLTVHIGIFLKLHPFIGNELTLGQLGIAEDEHDIRIVWRVLTEDASAYEQDEPGAWQYTGINGLLAHLGLLQLRLG